MKAQAIEFMMAMGRYARGAAEVPYCLSLLGPSGTGKTWLARAIRRFFGATIEDRVIDHGLIDGIWRCKGGLVEWGSALGTMLNTGDWSGVARFKGDFLVVLDDLAAESAGKMREISASKLFDILNARLGRRWTVVTANCDLEGVGRLLDPRIASRLIRDGNVCVTLPAGTRDFAMLRAGVAEGGAQ